MFYSIKHFLITMLIFSQTASILNSWQIRGKDSCAREWIFHRINEGATASHELYVRILIKYVSICIYYK
jgi:hypothetical protein